MRVSIAGSGYVGLTVAVGFASLGHDIVCVDREEKVKKINSGILPIYEEGLQNVFEKFKASIRATTNLENAVMNSDITFITVGTPSREDGNIDLSYVNEAAMDIAKALRKKEYHLVVVKSTVLPGTTDKIIKILEENSRKHVGKDFGICVNPEFLREGSALKDFLEPDRIVIGEYDKKSGDILEKLYENFRAPIIRTNLKTAEMIKYASNAFLATKISLTNEIGNMCKKLGIDVYDVMLGVGLDHRIGKEFLRAGVGFGGSCFKKDLLALIFKAKELNCESDILNATLSVNEKQPMKSIELLKRRKTLKNKNIAVLGLTFKPNTDDVRDSPAIKIIQRLLEEEANVFAYDPKGIVNMKRIFPENSRIIYTENAQEAINNSEIVLLVTDWPEFNELNYEGKVVIDGKNVLSKDKRNGLDYEGICW